MNGFRGYSISNRAWYKHVVREDEIIFGGMEKNIRDLKHLTIAGNCYLKNCGFKDVTAYQH